MQWRVSSVALMLGISSFQTAAFAAEAKIPVPISDPGTWVTPDDYPVEAYRNKAEGVVIFLLAIGTNGTPLGCEITRSSGIKELDEATCRLVSERARFTPALGPKGVPTIGTYRNSVRWVMPRSTAETVTPFSASMTFILGADGKASDCKLETIGEAAKRFVTQPSPCDAKGQIYTPLVDNNMKPVAKRITMKSAIVIEDIAP